MITKKEESPVKVHLTYFNPNGKYYASGEYDSMVPAVDLTWPVGHAAPPLYQIFEEVAVLKVARRLPGLMEGHSKFAVLIDVPSHPHRHPHLLPAEDDLRMAQVVVRAAMHAVAISYQDLAPVAGLRSALLEHDTTVGPLDGPLDADIKLVEEAPVPARAASPVVDQREVVAASLDRSSRLEPCGNEDCDRCDKRPRWKVSQHRVQHLTHARTIKAVSEEEALRIYAEGTAWPSSYDDRDGAVVQRDPVQVELLPSDEYHLTECCWHDLPDLPAPSIVIEDDAALVVQEGKRDAALVEERDALRAMVVDLLASAHPHPVEHPRMSAAWARGQALLQKYPAGGSQTSGLVSSAL